MTVALKSSNVTNIDGQSVNAGQTGSFAGSATFSFVGNTTAFNITGTSIQGGDTSDYSVAYTTPTTITGYPSSVTLSAQEIAFTVSYANDNTPQTLTGNTVSAVFATGTYIVSAGGPQANGTEFGTSSFTVSGLAGYVGLDNTGNRIWSSKTKKTRLHNQGMV